jgi:hypothetical protein
MPENPKDEETKGVRSVESDKYGWDGMMTLQGDPLVATLFLRVTHLLGKHVNHQGEMRQKA